MHGGLTYLFISTLLLDICQSYGGHSTRKGNKFYKGLAYNFWHPVVFKQTFWPFRLDSSMPVSPGLSEQRTALSLVLHEHCADQIFYSENITFFKWYNSQFGS